MEKQEDRMDQEAQAIFTQWFEILVGIARASIDSYLASDPNFPMSPDDRKWCAKMVSNRNIAEATFNIFANGLIAQGYIPTIDLKLRDYKIRHGLRWNSEQEREATERSN